MAFISKEIEGLLNQRILEEEKSSRLYLSMSKWLDFNGYFGASKLWKKYSDEEFEHSKKAYSYLEDLNILPTVPPLPEPICEFATSTFLKLGQAIINLPFLGLTTSNLLY